jgi:tRNA A-37 threonylcarbamoyl transferase component Bud32
MDRAACVLSAYGLYLKKVTHYTEELLLFCHRELVENKKTNAALDKKLKEATLSVEISAKQELVAALEEAQRTTQDEKEQLLAQIEELRLKVRQAEEQHSE